MRKQLSMDFNMRRYVRSGDFELSYYNDTALKSVDAHEHDYYEFYFLLEGDATYHIGDKSHQLECGDCLLISSDTPHYPRLRSYDKPYRRFVSQLDQDYHKKLYQTSEDLTYCFDYAQSYQIYRFHTDTITTQEIQGKFTDLMEEFTGGRSFHRLVSELMAVSLLMYINRPLYDSLHQKSAVCENALYLNICDYISRHLEEDLSLDSLSSFFYANRYYIPHIFKDNTGVLLHQYILRKWSYVNKNAILFNQPISHVYLQHGFKDYISFFRVFKKEYGVSPKEYWEQHRLPEQQDYIIQGDLIDMNTPDVFSFDTYRGCILRPRMCKADRNRATGYYGYSSVPTAARVAPHHWEKLCISGSVDADGGLTASGGVHSDSGGSGAVFLSGCTLGCCLCQNHKISSGHLGRETTAEELDQVSLRLQDQGAYNINPVVPTQYLPHIISALDQVCFKLTIPMVYNCGGHERAETAKVLKDYVDIWLSNFKYYNNRLTRRYFRATDYLGTVAATIRQVIGQTGAPTYRSVPPGPLAKGIIIRHMVLSGQRRDSIALLEWINGNPPRGQYMISSMNQYTPCIQNREFLELSRRIASYEYDKVVDAAIRPRFTEGFMQEKGSAGGEYTPSFDLEGL